MVHHPPRGAHHHVRAAGESDRLRDRVDAADEHRAPHAARGAQGLHLLRDLDGQFAGGGQDEGVEGLGGVHEAL